jgi:Immunity protein 50
MTTDDWSAHVANPKTLRDVLGSRPRPLLDYRLDFVHVDERESSITLGFHSRTVPDGVADLWQARGHDAVKFSLACTGVTDLVVDGWTGEPLMTATVSGSIVVLEGAVTRISFEVAQIHAEPPQGYRHGSP